MKKTAIFYAFILLSSLLTAQNKTDISLQWKDSTNQSASISSATGNLYKLLKHHGPAVENEWLAFRFYFDPKVSIDVYNKIRPGLELAAAGWYPTAEQQKQGWGADQYKVANTMGCGGVRLWDGEKEILLNPVRNRIARVCKEANQSYMEMQSEGIPYKGDTIDVLVRVTVFSGKREAKVEAFALCDKPVQFLTGINYFPTTKTTQAVNFISTWGVHPEDVAAFQQAIGAAVIFNPEDFVSLKKTESEYQLIAKPGKYLSTWISSTCEKEPRLNTMEKFNDYLKLFKK
ncbi:MAG: DUF4861 family protein [Bacteroidota bacterium]|nr:DUF4861 family protein [Bacteroidota bacterium]